jgi:hypothetical protein
MEELSVKVSRSTTSCNFCFVWILQLFWVWELFLILLSESIYLDLVSLVQIWPSYKNSQDVYVRVTIIHCYFLKITEWSFCKIIVGHCYFDIFTMTSNIEVWLFDWSRSRFVFIFLWFHFVKYVCYFIYIGLCPTQLSDT